jgi:cyclic pyranopterin phosphate synthase
MPPEGVKLLAAPDVLSYEELLRVLTILGKHGVSKVRLTGGEPLVRKGIVDFIRSIRSLGTIEDIAMTTNGSLLGGMAHQLKAAGLDRVNISIDTLDSERFARITRRGKLEDTLKGMQSAIDAGLSPVKLNVVLTEALSEEDIHFFVAQVHKQPITVRFIEYMSIGHCSVRPGPSIAVLKSMINKSGYGILEPAISIKGNGPAKYYRLPQSQGIFGFIAAISEHFCHGCNRIRLTADGKIKPCLLANEEIDIKAALRSGGSDRVIYELIQKALLAKPVHHGLDNSGESEDLTRGMFQVGG